MTWSSVRLVVFDLDGTLVDSVRDLASAVNAALHQLAPGTPPLPLPRIRGFIGDGARLLVARSLGAAGLAHSVEAALPVLLDAYRQRLLDTTQLYPGVRETLEHLRERRLAVLTNKPGDMSRTILTGLGIADRFFRILGGGDVPQHKPDPAGLAELMREAAAAPEQTVVVGDSAIDVRTGRALGTRTVGVTYGFAPESLLTEPPDALIDDMRRLLDLLGPGLASAVVR
jgi:phosphoglycolate phosphatase